MVGQFGEWSPGSVGGPQPPPYMGWTDSWGLGQQVNKISLRFWSQAVVQLPASTQKDTNPKGVKASSNVIKSWWLASSLGSKGLGKG